jgi:hypothetical protein
LFLKKKLHDLMRLELIYWIYNLILTVTIE